ncbi:MAG: CvpA family protein [Pirellulales bacterium]
MFLTILLVLIFVAVFAALMTQGLWSNTITLVNVITAGLVATNYFEPLAQFLERQEPSFAYVWDLFALWILFGVTMVVLRAATDYMSNVKVRFFKPVEVAGGYLMAVWVGWIMVCFATMTMHTAPLARHFLGDAFQRQPDSKMLFGLAPDRVWLAWVHRESKGALSRFGGLAPFDPQGDYILRYSNRRGDFEKQMTLTTGGGTKSGPEEESP